MLNQWKTWKALVQRHFKYWCLINWSVTFCIGWKSSISKFTNCYSWTNEKSIADMKLGQHFISFELRALAHLWGHYGSKTSFLHRFWLITFLLQSNQNFVYIALYGYSSATFRVLIAKVYVLIWAHYVT